MFIAVVGNHAAYLIMQIPGITEKIMKSYV